MGEGGGDRIVHLQSRHEGQAALDNMSHERWHGISGGGVPAAEAKALIVQQEALKEVGGYLHHVQRAPGACRGRTCLRAEPGGRPRFGAAKQEQFAL